MTERATSTMADTADTRGRELPLTPPGRHWQPPSAASAHAPRPPQPQRTEVEQYVDHILAELAAKQRYASSLEVELRLARAELAELRARVSTAETKALRGAHAEAQLAMTRYRIADIAHAQLRRVPWLHRVLRSCAVAARAWRRRRRS